MHHTLTVLLFVSTFASINVCAQDKPPMHLGDFVRMTSEEIQARLDGVMLVLRANPNSRLHFFFSREEKETFGSPHRFYGKMRAFLVGVHKVDPKRVVASFCKPGGVGQMWLEEQNGTPHQCEPENIVITETTLFDSAPHSTGKVDDFYCCIVDSFGPIAAVESLRAFADLLRRYPDSKAYVYSYGGTNVYWTSDARGRNKTIRNLDTSREIAAMSREARSILTEKGIAPSRIVAKNAGYRDAPAQIDMWIVPAGGLIPKPSPDYPRKRVRK